MAEITEEARQSLRCWIRERIKERRTTATAVAKEIGIATTTLTKFLNDPGYTFTPSSGNVAKLEAYFGQAAPRGPHSAALPSGEPAASPAKLAAMGDVTEEARQSLRRWIRERIEERRTTPTAVAKEIGIATTTLTKFLNDDAYKFTPSTGNVARLEAYFGQAAPRSAHATSLPASELEVLPIDLAALPESLAAALEALRGDRQGIEFWEVATRALEGIGTLPGDIVVIDPHAYIYAGEPVLAQIQNGHQARMILRLYEKPYLMPAMANPASRRPILVDDVGVIIKGVMTERISPRRRQSS